MSKGITAFAAAVALAFAASAQEYTLADGMAATPGGVYSLDSCRALALRNNKQLMMARQKAAGSEYQKKEAFAAYLPGIDFTGGYTYNQKDIHLLGQGDYMQPLSQASLGAIAQKYPHLGAALQGAMMNPQTAPMVGEAMDLANGFVDLTNNTLRKSTSFDINNVFFGAVTLTQPIYMGGKIAAMNKLAQAGLDANRSLAAAEAENVVVAVDAAYWLVVSLKAKQELAESFVNMLDTLDRDVAAMVEQGLATRAQKLEVDVKLNQARVDLTKVENGLVLSRMALAQVCGLPVNSDMHPADEPSGFMLDRAQYVDSAFAVTADVLNHAYNTRPDLQALDAGIRAAAAEKRVAMSSMLPKVALVGAYSFSNPNAFDGFRKRFGGAFSVGAMVSIPIWHWGGNYNKYKAAESNETVMRLRMADSHDLIDLQINQAAFKARESLKTYKATQSNLESANENLRCATVGFREGVMTSTDVTTAQTAWLLANSSNIDAMIECRLCDVYLNKVTGRLPQVVPAISSEDSAAEYRVNSNGIWQRKTK